MRSAGQIPFFGDLRAFLSGSHPVASARGHPSDAVLVGGAHLPSSACALPHGLGRRPDALVRMAEAMCREDSALPRLASAPSERIVGMARPNAL